MAHGKVKKEPSQVANDNWKRYVRLRDNGHSEYVTRAKKYDRFYCGEQWDPTDAKKLADEGRPALTINTILSTVNTVLGEQTAKRAEMNFKPRSNGNEDTATALTKVVMQIGDNNKLDWVESQVFSDGLIQDRGYFDVRINFDDSIQGEVEIHSLDPLDVLIDVDAKEYDPATWNEVITTRWLSLDQIESTYGEKVADSLSSLATGGDIYGGDSVAIEDNKFGDSASFDLADDGNTDKTIRSVRVVERQHRRMCMSEWFIDPQNGDMRPVPENWDKAKRQEFGQQFGLFIQKRLAPRVRWTVSADKVLLHDEWSPYKTFTVVPYFSYFRRGKPFGMVKNLISPQEQLNKISSQELHIVNTTANSGWITEEGSLVNMTNEDLTERGAETGLHLVHARGTNPPSKIQPNQIPTGIDRITQKAAHNIKEISGVSDAMLGYESAEVSGVALKSKQERGQIQIQVPLDNLARTRHMLAEKILELVQQFYVEERLIQITNPAMPDPSSPDAQEQMAVNQVTPEGEILNDLTLGEYSVVISTQPARDNFEESQFSEALQLRQAGVMIPDYRVIEYSHLAQKRDIAVEVKKLAGLAAPSEEEMKMQQQQQELTMKAAELELANLEADQALKEAQSMLAMAKADELGEDGNLHNRGMEELKAKVQLKREELDARMKLSQITAQTRQQDSITRTAVSLMQNDQKERSALDAKKTPSKTI
tara:strand:- start:1320 stop:3446 length:2127 start_codon:yes stop_codon:yes gene_type:complete